ncbi:DUF4832 domain-containing protein [Paenibacillus sp. N4]|uniref:DUF4832 domain-containing protein n=1 Tax=Paenibacillus vietnamensis TaxID=2590547 RepID=UPI001CD11269|nr:DUF4832 domain-containing protein [Paenibacillus vietnamensis]MCA0754209.1 DUF4832 domain-containing protein [Paenibacillus vietnamensis]
MRKIAFKFVLAICMSVMSVLLWKMFNETQKIKTVIHKPSPISDVLNNPYMGFAPSAVNGPYPYEHSLVYKVLTWRELEPEKGKFAFEEIEAKYKLEEWSGKNVKLIIRVVLDYSTDTPHLDIPDWAYEEIKGDGIRYDEEVGKGFSPNYSNPVLIQLHKRLIRALGERYDNDPRIAFFALGSLGHWGEWHTYSSSHIAIPFPALAVSDQYVQHYLEAFPNKKLLLRRPYPIAKNNHIGLYNDGFGSRSSTNDFIDWFENGYLSVLAGDVKLPAMPNFWKSAPSGGEFSSGSEVLSFLRDDQIGQIIEMAKRSHVSWLGPPPLSEEELTPAAKANMEKLLKIMGYRLRVETAAYPQSVIQGSPLQVDVTIANDGVAPFYYDWPVELSLMDEDGRVVASRIANGLLTNWLPGQSKASLTLPIPADTAEGEYRLLAAVLDPDRMTPAIKLAMDGKQPDGRYLLGGVNVRKQTALVRLQSMFRKNKI